MNGCAFLTEPRGRFVSLRFSCTTATRRSNSTLNTARPVSLKIAVGLSIRLAFWSFARPSVFTSHDNFAEFALVLMLIAATCGKMAHEIIELQKLEIGEVAEPFEPGKVGSSRMPQKRNPMICEAIESIARLTRAQTVTSIDATHHGHERDWASFQMEWSYLQGNRIKIGDRE
ncbi:MAG: lyase family protein [Chloroflexota bacterium]